jgi:hypothetical protein
MTAKIEFFPVDNGDMTLLTLESGKRVLIDINIRQTADDEDETDVPDVAAMLRDRLERDADKRLYVDAFLLTHPDADHCRGLERHFHLGKPSNWKTADDKIIIREMWSSPIIFRRKCDVDGKLCDDANAWWAEARRRVAHFRATESKSSIKDGDRIQVLGEDIDGKTDDLADILVKTDAEITKICAKADGSFSGWLLAPMLASDEEEKKLLERNHSSTIVRFSMKGGTTADAGRFLTAGDAEVAIWERVWNRNKKRSDRLSYDILLTPHHCSWHSLSHDSWSNKKEKAEVSADARSALSQTRDKAFLIASSKEIVDNADDPPCIRAKREYEEIASDCEGKFLCVADEVKDDVLLFEIDSTGPSRGKTKKGSPAIVVGGVRPRESDKQGGGRYA